MNRTKWTAVIAVVVMLISLFAVCAVPASAAASLTVTSSGAVKAGEEVTVNVSLGANSGVMGATFRVTYDATALTLVSDANGTLFANYVGTDSSTINSNPFRVSVINNSNVTASGVVFSLTFAVKETAAAGNYAVSVSAVKAANYAEQAVSIGAGSGNVTVEEEVVEPPVDPDVLLGDVNGDGKVALIDLLRLLKYVNGKDTVIVTVNSDINQDGKISLIDAVRLLNIINR